MSRFKLFIFLSTLAISWGAQAAAEKWSVSTSLVGWQEQVSLQNANLKDAATANFFGNGLHVALENYFQSAPNHGTLAELGAIFGSTTVGGTQQILTYQASNIGWWGGAFSYRYAYRLSDMLVISIGPQALARQITYANLGGTTATSGASFNYGLLADMKARLTEHLEIHQSIGTLALNASTLWCLGFGYSF